MPTLESRLERERKLNEIGIALSRERSLHHLMHQILLRAKELTRADGGTLYMAKEGKLHFERVESDSLHLSVQEKFFIDLPLFVKEGVPNHNHMATSAFHSGKTLALDDVYTATGFDFSGTRAFDKTTGYRTRSVVTVPIKNHEGHSIGVLQLLNAQAEVGVFTKEDVQLLESLASQAGVALSNQLLIAQQKELFESLIRVIAEAIDEKSPTTGRHGERVPLVAEFLAKAVNETGKGHLSSAQIYELKVAAFLHDCGKITTPDHLIDKATKLQTVFDRIALIETRFELMQKELLIRKLKGEVQEEEAASLNKRLEEGLNLIQRVNLGKEAMTPSVKERLHTLAKGGLLTSDELENLLVAEGTLTEKERKKVENHVLVTMRMLKQLTYPKELQEVPEIAICHHEWVNGKGYPRGLRGEQMSLQARILIIADIFEALSAPDRAYKRVMPLSEVLAIMSKMVEDGHLDRELFTIFVEKKVALDYGRLYLAPDQIDI